MHCTSRPACATSCACPGALSPAEPAGAVQIGLLEWPQRSHWCQERPEHGRPAVPAMPARIGRSVRAWDSRAVRVHVAEAHSV